MINIQNSNTLVANNEIFGLFERKIIIVHKYQMSKFFTKLNIF